MVFINFQFASSYPRCVSCSLSLPLSRSFRTQKTLFICYSFSLLFFGVKQIENEYFKGSGWRESSRAAEPCLMNYTINFFCSLSSRCARETKKNLHISYEYFCYWGGKGMGFLGASPTQLDRSQLPELSLERTLNARRAQKEARKPNTEWSSDKALATRSVDPVRVAFFSTINKLIRRRT